MYYGMSYVLRTKDNMEKMVASARKQGLSEEKIKLLVGIWVNDMLKKVKESQTPIEN